MYKDCELCGNDTQYHIILPVHCSYIVVQDMRSEICGISSVRVPTYMSLVSANVGQIINIITFYGTSFTPLICIPRIAICTKPLPRSPLTSPSPFYSITITCQVIAAYYQNINSLVASKS